ncbi:MULTISPECIES: hypothetical protein [Parafrankia]|uniref:hypothetical protein n=1 Tax=Parafrankia TaxID=2994362 RepID=UPI001865D7F7|nr:MULTISPECIES: hypothetical protein [Parafrankia]MBE3204299.1 hypothetical protein [Parafrankia sp. CH37]
MERLVLPRSVTSAGGGGLVRVTAPAVPAAGSPGGGTVVALAVASRELGRVWRG